MAEEGIKRQPLSVKNLADLKRHIQVGMEFVSTFHQNHPDIVGLTRVVTEVQSNAFIPRSRIGRNIDGPLAMAGRDFAPTLKKRPITVSTVRKYRYWIAAKTTGASCMQLKYTAKKTK